MPIYAYKCDACGHAQDILRKISDPALTECPACKAAAFSKQVTAAGFQLKGSGWYVTDFRGGDKKPAAGDASAAVGAKTDAAPAGSAAAAPSAPAISSASVPSAAPATASVAASAGNTGAST